MNSKRFWRRNGKNVVFGVLIVGSLAFQRNDIGRNMATMGQMKQELEMQTNQQTKLELGQENLEAQAKIANARLKTGSCTPVVDAKTVTTDAKKRKVFNLAPLQVGKSVNDRGNLTKLVPGTCVIGAFGETGIIQSDWTVGEIAVGGDKKLIDKTINAIAGRSAVVYRLTPKVN
jgi:hypothetical protein